MDNSSLGNHCIDVDRVALIDVPDAQLGEPWNWNEAYWRGFGAPWGGMFATVADINSFTQMFLHNGLLGENTDLPTGNHYFYDNRSDKLHGTYQGGG